MSHDLLATTAIFLILSLDRVISWVDGLILLFLFGVYLRVIIHTQKTGPPIHITKKILALDSAKKKRELHKWAWIGIIGLSSIFLGSKFAVSSILEISKELKVSEGILSSVFLAIGTSLPELSVSVTAMRKGLKTIAFGTLIGSNIFNMLAIGGVAALITPLVLSLYDILLFIPYMFILTLVLYKIITTEAWFFRVLSGALLLILYAGFLVILGIVGW